MILTAAVEGGEEEEEEEGTRFPRSCPPCVTAIYMPDVRQGHEEIPRVHCGVAVAVLCKTPGLLWSKELDGNKRCHC